MGARMAALFLYKNAEPILSYSDSDYFDFLKNIKIVFMFHYLNENYKKLAVQYIYLFSRKKNKI